MNQLPLILTVRQFAEKHPFITQGGIRWLLYSSPEFRNACARQLGRRVYLVEEAVLEFILQNKSEVNNDSNSKERAPRMGA